MYDKRLEPVLLDVQKPGRYVGGELNSVIKNKNEVDVRFAFCFPDTYEIGMSHLGMKILYGAFNERPEIWCERVFAPWIDMEEQMRRLDVPLYALESGDPLDCFDFIGFTLQYELSYTNILNMLELGGIPLKSSERTGLSHIVLGGGPCACNPEPLAEFFDLFCLGDGEEIDLEVIDLWRQCRDEGCSRQEFLRRAAKIPGVYVPSLYTVTYHEDGTVESYTAHDGRSAPLSIWIPCIFPNRLSCRISKRFTTAPCVKCCAAATAAAASARRAFCIARSAKRASKRSVNSARR